jgi:hypothetical protein
MNGCAYLIDLKCNFSMLQGKGPVITTFLGSGISQLCAESKQYLGNRLIRLNNGLSISMNYHRYAAGSDHAPID